jgi:hypothetical protein
MSGTDEQNLPPPGLPTPSAHHILGALSLRDPAAALALCAPDAFLRVRAAPGVTGGSHEHLWRNVRLQGEVALLAYLEELLAALPAITVTAAPVRSDAFTQVVAIEASGVDSEGLPFLAYGCCSILAPDGRVADLRVDMTHVEVGAELLSRPGNPRRFFHYFLEAGGRERRSRGAA